MKKTSSAKVSLLCFSFGLVLLIVAYFVPIDGQAGDGILRFLGRFHVLILHFPITLLIIAPLTWLLSQTKRYSHFAPAIMPLWWLGSITAVVTVTMGLLLAANEGLSIQEVQFHMYAGMTVAFFALICTGLAYYLKSNNKERRSPLPAIASSCLIISVFVAAHAGGNLVHGSTYLTRFSPEPFNSWFSTPEPTLELSSLQDTHYVDSVRPLLRQYCFDCHGPDTQKGNVRLDNLDPDFASGLDAPHWHAALDMINSGEMPPKKKKQPTDDERREIVDWMTNGVQIAKEAKKGESQQVIRRLTKAQYTNTLKDLLGVDIQFGAELPNDPLSAMGFSNNGELLQSSVLHLESFENIARSALKKVINIGDKPKIHHYRMNFGDAIGADENNTLSRGYLDTPLHPDNFNVQALRSMGDEFNKIKPYFSASLRGSHLEHFSVEDKGVSLYSALPHIDTSKDGQFGAWHGPSPNLAMQIKDQFPREGNFIVRVKASKGQGFSNIKDTLLPLVNGQPMATLSAGKLSDVLDNNVSEQVFSSVKRYANLKGLRISENNTNLLEPDDTDANRYAAGSLIFNDVRSKPYQIDLVHPELAAGTSTSLKLTITPYKPIEATIRPTGRAPVGDLVVSTIAVGYISKTWHNIIIDGDNHFPGFSHLVASKLDDAHPLANNYPTEYLEAIVDPQAEPVITPYIGTRTDDGMDYKTFGKPTIVNNGQKSEVYEFEGRLENLPIPFHGTQGDHITSSSMKVGLWNDDKRKHHSQKGSVLNVEYIEFEAPYFKEWPTPAHQRIFISNNATADDEAYAKTIISNFAQRAFRRPVNDEDIMPYVTLWKSIKNDFEYFEESILETLVAVLTSPNFLFLAEPSVEPSEHVNQSLVSELKGLFSISSAYASDSPYQPGIDQYALASRLSYFLWNSPPDGKLLDLAKQGKLTKQIPDQMRRMLNNDDKVMRFIEIFSKEWLRLDRQQMQSVDLETYPDYTRFVKQDMYNESLFFMKKLIQDDLSVLNIIDSDFAMLNQNLAEFYGVANVKGHEFRAVPFAASSTAPELNRGGLLTQGAFLTGHADGMHSHPVKRAVWLKQKILGDEPPPPPPNVPDLDPETPGFEKLTLKQQLEVHRDKESCRDCHAKIDPYGVVFEHYDAVGRYRAAYKALPIDASSLLPDGTQVNGLAEIKNYLFNSQADEVTKAFIKYLFSYAVGKDVNFHDEEEIDAILQEVKRNGYSMQSILLAIITSPSFLKAQGAI